MAFFQKHTVEQRYPSLTNGHSVVIYSALNDRGKEEYFVCDLTEAINVAHLLKIGPPIPGLALFGPRGDLLTDYYQCFNIPFEDFLKDRTFYKKKSAEYIIQVEKNKPKKVDLDFSDTIGIWKDSSRDAITPVRFLTSVHMRADNTLIPVSILENCNFFEPLSSWFPELASE